MPRKAQQPIAEQPYKLFKPYAIYIRIPASKNIIRIHNIDPESNLIEFLPIRVYDNNYAQIEASLNFIFNNLVADAGVWQKPILTPLAKKRKKVKK